MRRWLLVSGSLAALALVVGAACEGAPAEDRTAGGAGGSGAGGADTTSGHGTIGSGTLDGPGPPPAGPFGTICNSGYSTGNEARDACLTISCCDELQACLELSSCRNCVTDVVVGCDTDDLFRDYIACSDERCPTDICESGIGYYDSNTGDPQFLCNACAGDSCCAEMTLCVAGGSEQDVDACLDCLDDADSAGCLAAPESVQSSAIDFNACVETHCASDCPPD